MAFTCGRYLKAFYLQRITLTANAKRFLASQQQPETKLPTSDAEKTQSNPESKAESSGWLRKLLWVPSIKAGHHSHSSLLADKDTVYEMQVHAVKPEFMEAYIKEFSSFVSKVQEKKTGAELAGSWTTEIGEQDEAVHIWKYVGGYPVLNRATEIYRTDQEFVNFRVNRNKMLRSRKNQILLAFTFWGDMKQRKEKSIYELRTYTLKPGTMIEWGNNWARGIHFRRQNNEDVGGFFSQIGEQYMVHHLWAYESLQSRKEVRESAWIRPGWDELVANTVPLIRHMSTRILIPLPFSPTK